MEIWFEYELNVNGETLIVEVRFYTSNVAANPIITDQWTYSLTAERVDVRTLRERLYDRTRQIEAGLERWNAINGALGGSQNTRINAESVFPDA